jgi:hypothetical protein
VALWFQDWYVSAYGSEMEYIGDETIAVDQRAADWSTVTEIGKQEVIVNSKQTLLDAATKDKDAVTRWEALAAEEAAAANEDVVRARTLLGELVEAVAPLARDETDARVALAEAAATER